MLSYCPFKKKTRTEKETLDTLNPNSYILLVSCRWNLISGTRVTAQKQCVPLSFRSVCGLSNVCVLWAMPQIWLSLHWQGFYYADHVNIENLEQRRTLTSSIVFMAKWANDVSPIDKKNNFKTFSFSMGITNIHLRDECLKDLGR